jgi:hypothetical protein
MRSVPLATAVSTGFTVLALSNHATILALYLPQSYWGLFVSYFPQIQKGIIEK